jgi:hypothetical protein
VPLSGACPHWGVLAQWPHRVPAERSRAESGAWWWHRASRAARLSPTLGRRVLGWELTDLPWGRRLVGRCSEKPPTALIQLLSDVCAYVAEHAATDVSMESPDNWTPRLMEFLRIVKYQGAADQLTMRQGLYNGDTDVVYPVLKWVLPQVEGLKKRAFVGYYLSKVQVGKTARGPP